MRSFASVIASTLAALGISACSQSSSLGTVPGSQAVVPTVRSAILGSQSHRRHPALSAIQHVVIIVQENRTVDNLFQFLPNANVRSYGYNSTGNQIPLQSESLTAPYDLSHSHTYWYIEDNKGQMNGFEQELCTGTCPTDAAYAYVPQSEVQPYYTLAEKYAFADNMYETDEGPSFPSHQYLVSGTSTVSDVSRNRVSNNPVTTTGLVTGGCDSPTGSSVEVITPQGQPAPRATPCFARQSLMNEMDAAGVSWKYYQATPGAGLWNAVDAIQSIWSNKPEMAANVISPSSQVLTDIASGKLAEVVWVMPPGQASDHPQVTNGSGPSWVASIVNAIGSNQQLWNSTAIFITWDDWGGFYDHVAPKVYNSFELGFRVPLIVVSPYAKPGYVSHVQHEFGSILKFTEETFGLPSLRQTDRRADDLSDCFSFTKQPMHFTRIPSKYPPSYFFHLPAKEADD